MKKLQLLALILAGLLAYSCQNEEDFSLEIVDQVETEVDMSKLIYFKGLPVNHHRFRTPIKELEIEHDYLNLKTLYNKRRQSHTQKKGSALIEREEELPNREVIVKAAEKRLSEFPYSENEDFENNLEMIQQDFPTLTKEQIFENINIIDEYYSRNLNYEVLRDVAENEEIQARIALSKNTAKRNQDKFQCVVEKFQSPWYIVDPIISGETIMTREFSYIRALISLHYSEKATNHAKQSSFGYFHSKDTQEDAYRHVLFSAFLAKYYFTISSKSESLRFSEAVGRIIEICGSNPEDGMYMDLHNNYIGRKLFNENSPYKTIKILFVKIKYRLKPSNETLKFEAENLVKNATFIDKFNSNNELTIEETKQRIMDTDENKVVYFSKELD